MDGATAFRELRDRFLNRTGSVPSLAWPDVPHFNWVRDYFDPLARDNDRPALRVVADAGGDETVSFAHLASRSHQLANFLAERGVGPNDRVLIMLGRWFHGAGGFR